MNNVFIIKTSSDSHDFQKQLRNFLNKHCKNTETVAAVYELNESGKKQAESIINK